jgi:hypothetical protein
MADINVSAAVDTMLRASSASAIRTAIGVEPHKQATLHASNGTHHYYGGPGFFVHRYDRATLTKQIADVSGQANLESAWSSRESLTYS